MKTATLQPTTKIITRPHIGAALIKAILLIACIQAARAAINLALYAWWQPGYNGSIWNTMGLVSFSFTGAALLAVFRPGWQSLGLEWQGQSKLARGLTIFFSLILLVLVLTSGLIERSLLVENLKNALLIPLFEELLFRGWIWGKIEGALPGKRAGLITWLIVAALFSLWHLGYMDSYLLRALPANPDLSLGRLLGIKLGYTLVIGLVVGLPRWVSGCVYGSLILHGLVNLFGR